MFFARWGEGIWLYLLNGQLIWRLLVRCKMRNVGNRHIKATFSCNHKGYKVGSTVSLAVRLIDLQLVFASQNFIYF